MLRAHDGEAYGRLLKPTYAAVKQAVPRGHSGRHRRRIWPEVRRAYSRRRPHRRARRDGRVVHPSLSLSAPAGVLGPGGRSPRASRIRVAAAGVKTKAWITEIGYPTHRTSGGSDVAAQARHCVRTLALLQSMPEVGKVFWYDFKDDGTDARLQRAQLRPGPSSAVQLRPQARHRGSQRVHPDDGRGGGQRPDAAGQRVCHDVSASGPERRGGGVVCEGNRESGVVRRGEGGREPDGGECFQPHNPSNSAKIRFIWQAGTSDCQTPRRSAKTGSVPNRTKTNMTNNHKTPSTSNQHVTRRHFIAGAGTAALGLRS